MAVFIFCPAMFVLVTSQTFLVVFQNFRHFKDNKTFLACKIFQKSLAIIT